jgi:hypothetical protein
VFILFFAAPSFAQTTAPWEVFAGYSFQRSNMREYFKTTPIIYAVRNQGVNLINGWDVSVTENMNRWFGGTLDISGHYRKSQVSGTTPSTNRDRMYTILYGPRLSYRRPWGIPFAHVLLGAAHAQVKVTPTGPRASDLSFAAAIGGGVDWNFRNKTAIRVVQAEYLRGNALGANQNSFRISAGIILYLGR